MLVHMHRKKRAISREGCLSVVYLQQLHMPQSTCSVEMETKMKNIMSVGGNCQENS